MSKRTISLPAIDRTVTLAAYLAAIRKAKSNPDATFQHGLTAWWPVTGRDIVRQFRQGIHDRINQGIPYGERS